MSNNETTAKQAGKFGLVGILNTAIDMLIFNFCIFVLGFAAGLSNIISVSIAIFNSYIWNKKWTFHDKDNNVSSQFIIFLLLSMVGMLINTGVVVFLTKIWTAPADLAIQIIHLIKLNFVFNDKFVLNNFAKVFAIMFSMVWNFITYKRFVFKNLS